MPKKTCNSLNFLPQFYSGCTAVLTTINERSCGSTGMVCQWQKKIGHAVPTHFHHKKDCEPGRGHTTKFGGEISELAQLQSSVIQCSSLGPAAYIVTASDLRPEHADNEIIKFADDTYLIIPASNSSTSELELDHIRSWATTNNLQLNPTKSKELIFFAQRSRLHTAQPRPCHGIEQVESITALGVTINNRFSVAEHVTKVLTSCSSLLYALRILRTHGMTATSLYDVFRATIIAKLLYCSPAWSGFCSAADIARLDAFLKRCKRYGYCPDDFLKIADLFSDADDQLFSRILHTPEHVLKPLLPNHTQHHYNLRDRPHNFELINKNAYVNDCHFIVRQLFKDVY